MIKLMLLKLNNSSYDNYDADNNYYHHHENSYNLKMLRQLTKQFQILNTKIHTIFLLIFLQEKEKL